MKNNKKNKDDESDEEYVEVDEQTNKKIQQAKSKPTTKGIIEDDRQITKPKIVQKQDHQYHNKGEKQLPSPRRDYQAKQETNNHKDRHPETKNKQDQEKKPEKRMNEEEYHNKKYKGDYSNDNFTVERHYPKLPLKNNQVFIKDNIHFDQFTKEIKNFLNKYETATLRAQGRNIVKAITVAEEINTIYKNKLQRINIPGTMQYEQVYSPKNNRDKGFTRNKKMSTIVIELSLKDLDKRHMGYQDNITEEIFDVKQSKQTKFKPKQKEQSKYNEGQYR